MFDFKDKTAVVTGGAQGIGKCISEEFKKHGANVAITMVGYIAEVALSVGINLLTIAPSVIAGTDILWLILGILVFYICMLGLASAFFYKFAVKKLRGNLNLA